MDFNQTKDNKIKALCVRCKGSTNHVVLQSVDSSGGEIEEGIQWADHYQIIQCQGCESLTFCHIEQSSEYATQVGDDEWIDGDIVRLYPKRSEKTRAVKEFYNVPPTVRRIYRETVECLNNEQLTLCAAGVRAVIEGICSAHNIANGPVEITINGKKAIVRKKNLEGKIAGLHEKGIMTKLNTSALHELRFLGNEALHELNPPSFEDLNIAVGILEHTIEAVYEIFEKAEEMKEKRMLRATKTKGSVQPAKKQDYPF